MRRETRRLPFSCCTDFLGANYVIITMQIICIREKVVKFTVCRGVTKAHAPILDFRVRALLRLIIAHRVIFLSKIRMH